MARGIKRIQNSPNGIQYIPSWEVRYELSPFVFLDAGSMMREDDGFVVPSHPHSGIGIITYQIGSTLVHKDSISQTTTIASGGVQWVQAGGGLFHSEGYQKPDYVQEPKWPLSIHQLWMILPPELEEADGFYENFQPQDLPKVGGVKIVSGSYDDLTSPLKTPYNLSYLDVQLKAGETLEVPTPAGQIRGFVFPREGSVSVSGQNVTVGDLGILEESEESIHLHSEEGAQFILVMSEPGPTEMVSGRGSIHTNQDSLNRSLQRIEEMAVEL